MSKYLIIVLVLLLFAALTAHAAASTPYPTTGSPTGANIHIIIFVVLLIMATTMFIVAEYANESSNYSHIILMGLACLLFAILSNIAISGNLTDEFSVLEDATLGYFLILVAIVSGISVGLYVYESIFYYDGDLE